MGVGIYRTDIDGAIKIEALDLTFPLKLRCSRHHLKFLKHLLFLTADILPDMLMSERNYALFLCQYKNSTIEVHR
jgi:hypothetical protein